jgi:hypothetical protein
MTVTVSPTEFSFVQFDPALIARIGDQLVAALGIDRPVHVEVDETTPLGRMRIEVGDAITVHVESGAFEDNRKPREQSEANTAANLGRALLRANDRIQGGFGEAPRDDDLSLRQVCAWDTYCAGRLARLGLTINQQRWLYNFRNRHGFTDAADASFERIWAADGLTWGELESISTSGSTSVSTADAGPGSTA